MKRILHTIFIPGVLLILSSYAICAESPAESPKVHIDRGNKYLINDRPFAAVEEFKLAIEKGAHDAILFRNLSIILYDLGFLDEAIDYMKKALSISPYANTFQMELGIIYLAESNYTVARKEFMEVLERNPGFSNAYYYIGETFYRTKDYDMSWMFAETAKQLKHKSRSLIHKLEKVSEAPDIKVWDKAGESLLIRQILVDTRSRADAIVKRIHEGELFEDVANEIDKTLNSVGGFLGHFKQSELHPKISKALSQRTVFSEPIIVETELGFHIVQRILPFNFESWKQMLADYRKSKKVKATSAKSSPQTEGSDAPDTMIESKISRNASLVSNKTEPAKAAVAEKTAPPEKTGSKKYLVFSGTFSKEKYAIKRNEKLQSLGLPSYIHQHQAKKGLVHTVVAGKFDTLRKAREAGKNIAGHGLDYFISK
jgi:tetratricopeptide (TPR) repeat protein